MGKLGRPKAEKIRGKRIGISVTEDEFRDIQRKAEAAQITVSDFAYRAVIGKDIKVPVQANFEMVKELNAIGRNINMIAKMSEFDERDRWKLTKYLETILEIKNKLKS